MFSEIYKSAIDSVKPNEELKSSLIKTAAARKETNVKPFYKYSAVAAAAVLTITVSIRVMPFITKVDTVERENILIENTQEDVNCKESLPTDLIREQMPVESAKAQNKDEIYSSADKKVTPSPKGVAVSEDGDDESNIGVRIAEEAEETAKTELYEEITESQINEGCASGGGSSSGALSSQTNTVELDLSLCAPGGFEVNFEDGVYTFTNGDANMKVIIRNEKQYLQGEQIDIDGVLVWKNGNSYIIENEELFINVENNGALEKDVEVLIKNIVK